MWAVVTRDRILVSCVARSQLGLFCGRGALRSGPACRVQASAGQWLESVEPCVELPAHCPWLSPATQMWFLGTQAWCDLGSGSENCLTWDRRSLRAVSVTRALRCGCTRARFSGEPPTPGGELRGSGLADAWCVLGESSCGWWGGAGWVPRPPRAVDRARIVPAGALCTQARLSWGSGLVWPGAGAQKSVMETTHKWLLLFDIKSGGSHGPRSCPVGAAGTQPAGLGLGPGGRSWGRELP